MRRGQLLSIDAMLSMVLVMFIFASVLSTSSMIKGEITSMLGWYERANIADNMLDVLVKTPGEPVDWEENPSGVVRVGLRDNNSIYALDYDKIKSLFEDTNEQMIRSLNNASLGKDFQLEAYLTKKDLRVTGSFPKEIYIVLGNGNDNVNIFIAGDSNGNLAFLVENVTHNGVPAPLQNQPQDLNVGDTLTFIPLQDIWAYYQQGGTKYQIPSGSHVKVYVTGRQSNLQFTYKLDNLGRPTLKITGNGQVSVIIKGNTPGTLTPNATVIYPTQLLVPTYNLTLINGTLVSDPTIINASKSRSPWIQYAQRYFTISQFEYNSPTLITENRKKRLLTGALIQSPTPYEFLEISVPPNEGGNVTLVAIDGSKIKALLIQKQTPTSDVKAEIAWEENDENIAKFYTGNTTTVKIPWRDIFEEFDIENGAKPVELWAYEKNFAGTVVLRDIGNLGTILRPRFEVGILKLWVWDDS